MNETLYTLWQWLTPVLLSAVAYFLKDLRRQLDREMAELKEHLEKETQKRSEEIAGLRRELNELKTSLPLNYVLREDHIRAQSALDNKLERIIEYTKR
jgi:hypothetical protein